MIFQNNHNYFEKRQVWFKGGSSGDTFDAAYNARMATIAEAQQGMAEDYFKFWEESYKPMEQAQIDANMELIPSETGLNLAQNEAALSLLPQQTAFASATMADQTAAMKEKAPVRSAFYQEALNGVDVEGRANKAAADAAQAFMGSQATLGRDSSRMGINPNSGRFAAMSNANALNRAKAISGARTAARTNAEQENFGRLTNAMGY
ncbi:hypothetical protein [Desulfobacula sp.]|uniref:hypothetical protein n=1 Tax=Desulfobacula sp. TaxID=2593537 RepID=UPI0026344054|nr:hypothetical protein [Desulfobacula sp.]